MVAAGVWTAVLIEVEDDVEDWNVDFEPPSNDRNENALIFRKTAGSGLEMVEHHSQHLVEARVTWCRCYWKISKFQNFSCELNF